MNSYKESVVLTMTPKRRPSINNCISPIAPSSPSSTTGFTVDMDAELPEASRLARSRFFLMTESPNGKVLGCGEEVGHMPEQSRFLLRIFNRDFKNGGKLKDYVELTIENFNDIVCHKSEIEKKIIEVSSCRQTILDSNNLKVTIGPGHYTTSRPTVEIEKQGVKSSMYIETFTRMMNYSTAVNEEYSRFNARKIEDTKVLNEILNALAYARNDYRANGSIWLPNVGRRSGIFTTCNKLVEQAKAILPKDD